ncbi:hypothetical protein ANCCAN_25072 [Ancylostoma caninum]|uniref:Uncharacterized protein n=1 Tax=Ancylostoma caninum TaxID=29170 RepID=A0A368FAT6_ANCCA|nr:hypothetical protein ANCCAN_25072 [Ancylostoma caninum]
MLTKQETNPQPSTSNSKESTAQSKNVLVKPSTEKTVEESKRTSGGETNDADLPDGDLQGSGSADTNRQEEKVTFK